MTNEHKSRRPAPQGTPVVQRPAYQPAPARVTRPIVTGGPRPDLPDVVTRALKR